MAEIQSLVFDVLLKDNASRGLIGMARTAKDAAGDVGDLQDKLLKVSKASVKARVGLDGNKEANADIDRLQARLIKLGDKTANPNITVEGALKARAEIASVQRQLDQLDRSNAITRLAGAGRLQPSAAGTLLGLAPGILAAATGAAAALSGVIGTTVVSLGAAGIGLGAFGLLAKQAFTGASTAAEAVQKAQVAYNDAISHGTKRATAYKTEQIAITKAYAGMSPAQIALSKQVGAFSDAWANVQKSVAPVVSGALVPWMGAVTKAMVVIRPLVTPVADLFRAWGQQLDRYFSSAKGSTEIRAIAAALGQFAAIQLADIVGFIRDLGTGIISLARDIGGAGVQYGAFGGYLAQWGQAFASWSKTRAARDDVQKFLAFMHGSGHTIATVAGELAKYIPGIFAGASAAGRLELDALGSLLRLLDRLPPSVARPLTEIAGAALLLSKTGVLKVGLQIVGKAWDLLRGGTLSLGGASAAAEIRAAMVSGGTAAAAEIRAAMAGGGAVAGGESAAGSAAASGGAAGVFARLGWTGKALTPILRAPLAAAVGAAAAWAVGHLVAAFVPPATAKLEAAYRKSTPGIAQAIENFLLGGKAAVINDAITRFQDMVKHGIRVAWDDAIRITQDAQRPFRNAFDFIRHGVADAFSGIRRGIAGIGHDIAGAFDTVRRVFAGIGHSIANTFDRVRRFQGQFDAFGKDIQLVRHWITDAFDGIRHGGAIAFDFLRHLVAATWDAIRHGTAAALNAIRHGVASAWDQIRHDTAASLAGLRHGIAGAFDSIRHGIAAVFDSIRHGIAAAWDAIFRNSNSQTRNGLNSIVGWFRALPGRVIGALFGLGHRLYAFGHAALSEFWNGLKSVAGSIFSWIGHFVSEIWDKVKKFFGISSPSSLFYDIGKNLMLGLFHGIKDHAHHAANAASKAAGAVGAQGGPTSASAAQAQAYARSRLGAYGWGASQMAPLIALWNQESGWNRLARNPSSGAYGIPQALPPSKMGAAANPPTSSAAAQINWGLGYIRSVYGSPAGAEAHERSAGWYGKGLRDGIFTRPTIIGVGERGPERVNVEPVSSGRSGRPGPLVHVENMNVREPEDISLVASKLSFKVTASGFG